MCMYVCMCVCTCGGVVGADRVHSMHQRHLLQSSRTVPHDETNQNQCVCASAVDELILIYFYPPSVVLVTTTTTAAAAGGSSSSTADRSPSFALRQRRKCVRSAAIGGASKRCRLSSLSRCMHGQLAVAYRPSSGSSPFLHPPPHGSTHSRPPLLLLALLPLLLQKQLFIAVVPTVKYGAPWDDIPVEETSTKTINCSKTTAAALTDDGVRRRRRKRGGNNAAAAGRHTARCLNADYIQGCMSPKMFSDRCSKIP
ncbi:hypothetical protein V3C99_006187, partial [Haemonchus contortus]